MHHDWFRKTNMLFQADNTIFVLFETVFENALEVMHEVLRHDVEVLYQSCLHCL